MRSIEEACGKFEAPSVPWKFLAARCMHCGLSEASHGLPAFGGDFEAGEMGLILAQGSMTLELSFEQSGATFAALMMSMQTIENGESDPEGLIEETRLIRESIDVLVAARRKMMDELGLVES